MNAEDKQGNTSEYTLKPELSFEWIKYKQIGSVQRAFDELKSSSNVNDSPKVEKIKSEFPRDESIVAENFKDDPIKERMFLWYKALFETKEMTLEQFSAIIQINDEMETEDFLFRHAPLKYSYLWRGKNLTFSDDTISKLEKELKGG